MLDFNDILYSTYLVASSAHQEAQAVPPRSSRYFSDREGSLLIRSIVVCYFDIYVMSLSYYSGYLVVVLFCFTMVFEWNKISELHGVHCARTLLIQENESYPRSMSADGRRPVRVSLLEPWEVSSKICSTNQKREKKQNM